MLSLTKGPVAPPPLGNSSYGNFGISSKARLTALLKVSMEATSRTTPAVLATVARASKFMLCYQDKSATLINSLNKMEPSLGRFCVCPMAVSSPGVNGLDKVF